MGNMTIRTYDDLRQLSPDSFKELIGEHQPPCISLYMPADPAFPGEMENATRLRDMCHRAQRQLRKGYPSQDVRPLLDQCLQPTGLGREFWNDWKGGLAIFCSPD